MRRRCFPPTPLKKQSMVGGNFHGSTTYAQRWVVFRPESVRLLYSLPVTTIRALLDPVNVKTPYYCCTGHTCPQWGIGKRLPTLGGRTSRRKITGKSQRAGGACWPHSKRVKRTENRPALLQTLRTSPTPSAQISG